VIKKYDVAGRLCKKQLIAPLASVTPVSPKARKTAAKATKIEENEGESELL
jgi:hypothetical protein